MTPKALSGKIYFYGADEENAGSTIPLLRTYEQAQEVIRRRAI